MLTTLIGLLTRATSLVLLAISQHFPSFLDRTFDSLTPKPVSALADSSLVQAAAAAGGDAEAIIKAGLMTMRRDGFLCRGAAF